MEPEETTQKDAEIVDIKESLPADEPKPEQQESEPEAKQEEPKETSRQTITIEVVCYEGNRQDIKVNTPVGSPLAENLGTLDIAKAILLRKL